MSAATGNITVRPEAVELFVEFVRLNPGLAAGDPLLVRVWHAYQDVIGERSAGLLTDPQED